MIIQRILVVLFFLLANSGITQIVMSDPEATKYELVLEDSLKDKTFSFREDKKIKLITNDNVRHVGYFKIVNDSTLQMNDQLIRVNDIECISNPSRVARFMSVVLTGTGVALGVWGIRIVNKHKNSPTIADAIVNPFIRAVGIFISATGAVSAGAGGLLMIGTFTLDPIQSNERILIRPIQ